MFKDSLRALRPLAWLVAWPLTGFAYTCSRARAEDAEQVALVMEPCDEASAAGAEELFRALQTELSPVLLYKVEPGGEAHEHAHARLEVSWCHGLSHLNLRTSEGDEQQRSLALSDTPPEVRARTIALSVGELWRAAQPEERLLRLAATPARAEPAPQPTTPERKLRSSLDNEQPLPPEARKPRPTLGLSAHGGMRAAPASDTMLFGGALALDVRRLRGGVVVLSTRGESGPAELNMGLAAGKFGLEFVRLGERPYLVVRALGELGITWAKVSGAPEATPTPQFALLAGGHLEVALVAAMSERWRGELAATFGYQRGLTARSGDDDEQVRMSTQGAAIGLSVGFTLLTGSER